MSLGTSRVGGGVTMATDSHFIAWAKFGRNGKEKTAQIRSYKTDRTADQTLLEIATQQSKLITPCACLSNCCPVRYPPTPSPSLPATRAFPICLVPVQTGSRATRVAFHSRSDPPRSGSRIPHATMIMDPFHELSSPAPLRSTPPSGPVFSIFD